MMVAATTLAALLIASPISTDADRIAAKGGFLVGNAHRCGVEPDRVVRAGELIRSLIVAASADDNKAQEQATMRFAEFFLVSAFADPGKEKLVASCRTVASELGRLEAHQTRLAALGSQAGENPLNRPFRLTDGE